MELITFILIFGLFYIYYEIKSLKQDNHQLKYQVFFRSNFNYIHNNGESYNLEIASKFLKIDFAPTIGIEIREYADEDEGDETYQGIYSGKIKSIFFSNGSQFRCQTDFGSEFKIKGYKDLKEFENTLSSYGWEISDLAMVFIEPE